MFTLQQELLRKLVHLSSVVYPIMYFFLSRQQMIFIFVGIFIVLLFLEILRILKVRFFGSKFFTFVIRPTEIKNQTFSGAVSFILACLIITVVFSKYIVILSIFILIICDIFASFVGRTVGRYKIFEKSLEGCLAFILSGIIVVYLFHLFNPYREINFLILVYAVLTSAVAELFAQQFRVDDNLLITIIFATTVQYFTNC